MAEQTVKKNQDNLFRFIDKDTIQSEKITAPRYSYWASVFRVFFRKKINIVLRCTGHHQPELRTLRCY